ncbi:DUF5107 domain-containing protein [Bifidobacterium eulemuris]|uniref:DUF5107 domain-containing protein n=1 Tax=Bifidobacterium eulemuris TaxID=1765219 RepID=A0A261FY18_9BIFI|nr:DUF5107 domain-containing protein [Bifidobacterium eulemuris]OZG64062.1 tetratricopeptide repeat protein [Bifidobacterium eulemuris]QOL32567.1 DUF5107 domain-containing protein [Bifidobacterium eulemuris]
MSTVTIQDTVITIPTYGIGDPDKNPQFIEKRVYQGSTGKVYPYPVVESIKDEKEDKSYKAVIIENEYLEVTVLPELGGRIQWAKDKTNDYDFVYRNDVIKPALVGLTGPWISGGIEFNWPQHHRPTTYLPVDYQVVDLEGGGKGVQCHDVDQMHGTEVVTTVALYPGKAYIEITGDLYNGTSFPQTFLWWANPAVPVNDHTRTVMPPDVTAVMDHGKRDVSRYPIATGTYYKHDYSEGVDIGRYKNVPVPTSYMAAGSDYDFVGGYDYGKDAGILHYADHHISPGKKQWVWGCGDFGQAWDRNLTDENGPYAELMTGVYTDNQPDFTWLKPFESKKFTQYFMPYKAVGLVKNATLDAAVNLEFGPVDPARAAGETEGVDGQGLSAGQGRVTVYATHMVDAARVVVATAAGDILFEETRTISPNDIVVAEFPTGGADPTEITVTVSDMASGATLVDYTQRPAKIDKIPSPAEAAPAPADVPTNEELFLTGLHLEQYRHATYLPDPYYLEGLKRDPGDARINNAYGSLLMRRGAFKQAKERFDAAIERLTRRNPNPYDSEAYYNLGLVELFLGEEDKAFDAFYKATWDNSCQEMGYYHMAAIAAKRGDWRDALDYVGRGLDKNAGNLRARGLKAYILRKMGRVEEAAAVVSDNLRLDAFDYVSGFERFLASGDGRGFDLMRGFAQNYLKAAREYAAFGGYDEALRLLGHADHGNPMVNYYESYYHARLGHEDEAVAALRAGESADSYCCFPNRLEDIAVLRHAIELGERRHLVVSKAPYYLGCLYYDKLQADAAIALWEASRAADPSFPTVHRNLSLAYYNKKGDSERASVEMEEAFRLDPTDPRVFLELDQLHRTLGWSYERRLVEFERHLDVIQGRDDLYIEYLTVLNMTGHHGKAYELMSRRHFHAWEGGEGKITAQYRISLTLLAKDAMAGGDWQRAKELLVEAETYPHNLGEGKLEGQKDNDLHYYLGLVERRLGNERAARDEFRLATIGPDEVKGAMYYNDQPAEMILFQGLAHQALGERGAANARFYRLLDFGEQHLDDRVSIEYFAVSLPDFLIYDKDYTMMNRVHCLYVMALARIGMGDVDAALSLLRRTLEADPSHIQGNLFLEEVERRHIVR